MVSYSVTAMTGSKYSFRHRSINANGYSSYSPVFETYACELPSPPGTPVWVTSTNSSISISWSRSVDDGGCPIIEYSLWRDAGDGSGATLTEIHQNDLSGNPRSDYLQITQLAASIGSYFKFQVRVHTQYTSLLGTQGIGSLVSPPMLLAGVPEAPSAAPRRGEGSGAFVVEVEYDSVGGNGAAVTSYFVEIDDGAGFVALQGLASPSLSLIARKSSGIVTGRYYRVRYRGVNVIGQGDPSPVAYILAADKPTVVRVTGS